MKFNLAKNIVLFVFVVCFSQQLQADPVWIDVRTSLENQLDSINGDVRISHGDIVEEVSEMYPDKNTEINLYCRSGGRAGTALQSLNDAGYKNVRNAGSIDDARKERDISE